MDDSKARTLIQSATEQWAEFWGDSLHSIHLYGSFARGDAHKGSDVNLLILLRDHDYTRWEDAAGIARRRIKKGFGVPLLLSESYIRSSLDVFPMEFLDIKLFHETLRGEDPFITLEIDSSDLRLQAEREIKGKWVALRQAALEIGGNTPAMRDLLAMSVPTWTAVFQALLVIDGQDVPSARRDVLISGANLAGCDPEVFTRLYDVRSEKGGLNRAAASSLLQATLQQVDALARYADRLDVRHSG